VEPGRNREGIKLDFLGLNAIYREAGIYFILGEITTGPLEAPDRPGQVSANKAALDTGGQIFVSAKFPGTTCPRVVYIHRFADPMQLGVTISDPNHVPIFFASLIARRGGLLDLGLPFSYEVLAHELGHQLGLPDANELGPSNVMWQGGIRATVPGLTREQIDKARGSVLVQKFGQRTDIDPYFDD
jgi:hypothetical protein